MHMKQTTGAALAAVVLLLASPTAGQAMGGGFHGGGFHGGGFHDGFHRGFDGRSRVFIRGDFFLGGPFWWGPPVVYSPPVVVEQPAPVYAAPPAPAYWYYCPNPQGYYPYVQQCPPGWMTVVPPAQ